MRGLSLFAYPLCYLYSNPHELYLTLRELWVPWLGVGFGLGLGLANPNPNLPTLTPS